MGIEEVLKNNILFNSKIDNYITSVNTNNNVIEYKGIEVIADKFIFNPISYKTFDNSSINPEDKIFSFTYLTTSVAVAQCFFTNYNGIDFTSLNINANVLTFINTNIQGQTTIATSIPVDGIAHNISIAVGQYISIYIDGVFDTQDISNFISNLSDNFTIGCYYNGTTYTKSFIGSIADFSILNLSGILSEGITEADAIDSIANNTFNNGDYKYIYQYSDNIPVRLTQTRDSIITRALRICNVLSSCQVPNNCDIENGALALQNVLEGLQNSGYRKFQLETRIYSLKSSDEYYGEDGVSYICIKSHTKSIYTVPISGSKWKEYWVVGGTATASSNDNRTFFNCIGQIELDSDIQEVLLPYMKRNGVDDLPINLLTSQDYAGIEDKKTTGDVFEAYVEYGVDNPTIYLHNYPSDSTQLLKCLIVKKINNLEDATDEPELSKNWYNYITYKLAEYLADEYDLSISKRTFIKAKSDELMKQLHVTDFVSETDCISYGAY